MPSTVARVEPTHEPTYTVSELNQVIARAVSRALPDQVWVTGEIRNLNRAPSGHVYFSLVDTSVADAAAQLPVVLFAADREAVNRALIRVSAGRIEDGMQVRIRGLVGHQAARGLVQLRMKWIDTDYTMGRLAADRRALLERLAAEGLLDRQSLVPIPVAPRRIGVVTSVGSAAHADFMTELSESGFGFTVVLSHATVQGSGAAASIAAALAALAARSLDVVAMVRGGGAQTDLAAFDTDMVARAVATAGFPVITGIGHEIDDTVTDRVAARSAKTPTAAAQLVVAMVRDFADRLASAEGGLRRAADRTAHRARGRLDARAHRLRSVTAKRFAGHGATLDRATHRLETSAAATLRHQHRRIETARHAVSRASGDRLEEATGACDAAARLLGLLAPRVVADQRRRVENLAALAQVHDPDRMLARGWSVTRTGAGLLVRSPDEVVLGDHLVTTTTGGAINSVVEGKGP